MKPLPPLRVPWSMKPLESAQTSVTTLPDGRLEFAIVHDVLRGVTPAMLVWWFNNMHGEHDVGFGPVPRYRLWHPTDHFALTYVRPANDGRRFGAGAQVRIQEFFGARPEYAIDVVSTIEFLNKNGFAHRDVVLGKVVAEMRYRFEAIKQGTRYQNSLVVGVPGFSLFNRFVRPAIFSEAKGRAWLRHNVEEVGNFEFFLPGLYEKEQSHA